MLLYSYGYVQKNRQSEIIRQLKQPRSLNQQNVDEMAKAFLKLMVAHQKNEQAI